MPYNEDQIELMGEITYRADAWAQGAGYPIFSAEQLDCLSDPARAAEALGMLQDLRDRVGLPEKYVAPLVPLLAEAMREDLEHKAHDFHALLDLQREWIGHEDFNENDQAEDIERGLRAWIAEAIA